MRFTGNSQPAAAGGRTFGAGGGSFRPPSGAATSHGTNGTTTYSHAGMSYTTDRNGRLSSFSKPGMETRYTANGKVRSAHFDRAGGAQMNISHGMHGERRVETLRPDHTRVVSWAPHAGYVERPFRQGYVSRTYLVGTRTYFHVYRTHYYRGVTYYRYVSPLYYGPRFYAWAWNPWPAPVVFDWGWRSRPWFDFYSGYFAPAPSYPTAALWLTDYLLAENLQNAWEDRNAALDARQDAAPDEPPPAYSPGAVVLTPDVKQALADEVRQQIASEYAAANQPAATPTSPAADQTPPALDPNQRIFVVSTAIAVNIGAEECGLTPGDIIARLNYAAISARNTVTVRVLGSKPGDCPKNATPEVDLATLQEMHNDMLAAVDRGLKRLAESEGTEGLPAGPPPDPKQSAEAQASADSAESVESVLTEQRQEAGQALQEIQPPGAGG